MGYVATVYSSPITYKRKILQCSKGSFLIKGKHSIQWRKWQKKNAKNALHYCIGSCWSALTKTQLSKKDLFNHGLRVSCFASLLWFHQVELDFAMLLLRVFPIRFRINFGVRTSVWKLIVVVNVLVFLLIFVSLAYWAYSWYRRLFALYWFTFEFRLFK